MSQQPIENPYIIDDNQRASYMGPLPTLDFTRYVRNNYTAGVSANRPFRDIQSGKELYKVCYKRGKTILGGHVGIAYFDLANKLRGAGPDDINQEFKGSLGLIDYLVVVTTASLASIMVSNLLQRKEQEHKEWKALRVFWNIFIRYPIGFVATVVELGLLFVKNLIFPLLIAATSIVWFPICWAVWKHERADASVNHVGALDGHPSSGVDSVAAFEGDAPEYQSAPPGFEVDKDAENNMAFTGAGPVQYDG